MLPRPIYEALPFVYVVAGIITLVSNNSVTTLFSGILLAIAGITVFVLRRNYRTSRCEYTPRRHSQLINH